MWLFTKYGFYSCACDTKHGDLNTDIIMVRSRIKLHIENLQERFTELRPFNIEYSKKHDYQYRIYVPKDLWADVTQELSKEMDYGKFKPSAEEWFETHGKDIGTYHDLLLEIWSVVYRGSNSPPYPRNFVADL